VKSLRPLGFILQSAALGLATAFVVLYFFPDLVLPTSNSGHLTASYSTAVKAAAPAVVNIYALRRVPAAPADEEQSASTLNNNLGSGVIVDAAGYILTNYHVIDGAESISVQLADGRTLASQVVGTDRPTDLALLRIPLDDLPAIKLGRSDTLEIGDVVLAIGNPYGLGQTVTQGIVSATGRWQLGLTLIGDFIQTDAAINLGNSGGALINSRGELVGINIATLEPALALERSLPEGIGFAIPVNLARGVMEQLRTRGRVIRGWLGVDAVDLTQARARELNLELTHGIELRYVFPDSPAAAAGLKARDVITEINDQPILVRQSAVNIVAGLKPGSTVELAGIRDGAPFRTQARVEERAE
jgi:serine protease DegS